MGLILPKRFGQDKPPVGSQINWGHPLARGLVGCWLFNEGAGGKAHDLSGRGNHGALTNFAFPSTPTSGWNPGRTGIGLKFDGVDDYVDCGNKPSLNITDAITIEAWVKSPIGDNEAISSKGVCGGSADTAWLYNIDANKKQAVWSSGGPWYYSNTEVPANQWSHVVLVFTPNKWKFYLNGESDGEVSVSYSSLPVNAYPVLIGIQGGCNFYHGLIDEVRIYNRALSAAEIQKHYAEGLEKHKNLAIK